MGHRSSVRRHHLLVIYSLLHRYGLTIQAKLPAGLSLPWQPWGNIPLLGKLGAQSMGHIFFVRKHHLLAPQSMSVRYHPNPPITASPSRLNYQQVCPCHGSHEGNISSLGKLCDQSMGHCSPVQKQLLLEGPCWPSRAVKYDREI